MSDRISEYIYSRRCDIVNELKRLIAIPSVNSTPEDGAPYGTECRRALDETVDIYSKYAHIAKYSRDGSYILSEYGQGEKVIGIFSHSDVVPADENWTVTKPFCPLEINGALFGRGSVDDKSGIIASLFAVNAIRDLKIPLNNKLVLFTGSNEESGMADIRKFAADEKMPDVSLVLDCAFPVYRGEKGIVRFWARSKKKLSHVIDVAGGAAFNIVLGTVNMILPYNADVFSALKDDGRLGVKTKNDRLIITAKGIAKHAALPSGSLNALYVLLDALKEHGISLLDDGEILFPLAELLNDYYGYKMGSFSAESRDFGKNSIVNGMVSVENGHLCLSYDIRHINRDTELLIKTINEIFEQKGFDIEITRNSEGFIIPDDDRFLKCLLKTYSENTGTRDPNSCINAGATYARYLKNAFSVGTYLGNPCPLQLPVGHGGVHQPDEYINIDRLLDAIAVITKMIIGLDRELM